VLVRIAQPFETPAVTTLINRAFEVEKFFIDGDRTNEEQVRQLFEKGSFLAINAAGKMVACVYVEPQGPLGYLGLLSVEPARHGNGLGKRLVEASENFARGRGCETMYLNIVNVREELPPFYRKLGYRETGTAPFHADATEKVKLPCHFIRMEKALRPEFE
jgi:predicted N-acetyltransferase YhbS